MMLRRILALTMVLAVSRSLNGGFRQVPRDTTRFQNETVIFNCEHNDRVALFGWYINATLYISSVPERGLMISRNESTSKLEVFLQEKWNTSIVTCSARMLTGDWLNSSSAELRVQGILGPVTNLDYNVTSTSIGSIFLSWKSPFSLDVTDEDPDFNHTVELCRHKGGNNFQLMNTYANISNSNYTVHLTGLQLSSMIKFTVCGVNQLGRGEVKELMINDTGDFTQAPGQQQIPTKSEEGQFVVVILSTSTAGFSILLVITISVTVAAGSYKWRHRNSKPSVSVLPISISISEVSPSENNRIKADLTEPTTANCDTTQQTPTGITDKKSAVETHTPPNNTATGTQTPSNNTAIGGNIGSPSDDKTISTIRTQIDEQTDYHKKDSPLPFNTFDVAEGTNHDSNIPADRRQASDNNATSYSKELAEPVPKVYDTLDEKYKIYLKSTLGESALRKRNLPSGVSTTSPHDPTANN